MATTSIQLPETIRDRIKARGIKGETYADILERMLEQTASEPDQEGE
ncbi:hypothetical protein [Haladaptatus salinisoli]|nr:hypothetical protein [Haladaptatus salinisoli]